MKLLVDENLPRPVVDRLVAEGHEVTFVGDFGAGMTDRQVLEHARPDQVIVTADKDFGDLVFRHRLATHAIFLVRLEGMSLQRRAEIVARCFTELGDRLLNSFTVIGHNGIRRVPMPEVEG